MCPSFEWRERGTERASQRERERERESKYEVVLLVGSGVVFLAVVMLTLWTGVWELLPVEQSAWRRSEAEHASHCEYSWQSYARPEQWMVSRLGQKR